MRHTTVQASLAGVAAQQERMMVLLTVATKHPCPPVKGGQRPDQVTNPRTRQPRTSCALIIILYPVHTLHFTLYALRPTPYALHYHALRPTPDPHALCPTP
jgi:hypothetical protein